MKALTDQQNKVLTFVDDFTRSNGFSPTLREIGDALELDNLNAVRGHLLALEKKGYIVKAPDKARSIRVLHTPSALSRLKRKIHRVLRTDEGVFHRVVYGLAWTTYGRRPYLSGPVKGSLSRAIDREVVERGWKLLEKKIEPDHVVLVVQTWPNHPAEQTVRRFQDAAAVLRRRYPHKIRGRRLWGKGYVVTTDLDMLDDLVVRLLEDQPSEEG